MQLASRCALQTRGAQQPVETVVESGHAAEGVVSKSWQSQFGTRDVPAADSFRFHDKVLAVDNATLTPKFALLYLEAPRAAARTVRQTGH